MPPTLHECFTASPHLAEVVRGGTNPHGKSHMNDHSTTTDLDAVEQRVRQTYAAGYMPDIADEEILLAAGRITRSQLRELEHSPIPFQPIARRNNMPAYNPTAAAHGGYDPNTPPSDDFQVDMPRKFASPTSRAGNDRTAQANSDGRTERHVRETNASVAAVRAQQSARRPALGGSGLTGGAADIWKPIRDREVGAFSRVKSRLEAREAGKTAEAILTAALDAGRKREAILEDLAEQLAEVAGTGRLIEASTNAVHQAGAMTTARLNAAIRDHRHELETAVHQDLADLVADAAQVARELEGITDAEVAIRRGQSAVVAWGLRDGIRERMLAVAKDLHFLRRATRDGFTYLRGGEPDHLATAGPETTFSSTWALVDELLEQLNATDATTDLLVGR